MSEDLTSIKVNPSNFYLTSLSSNTPEIIAHDIRSHFAEHPVTGLHKAELYIYSLNQAIRMSLESIASDKIKIDTMTRDLARLTRYDRCKLSGLYWLLTRKYLDLEIAQLEGKIRSGQMAIEDTVPMLEDAQAELDSAMTERTEILRYHPGLNTNKAELMKSSGRDRLIAKLKPASCGTMSANAPQNQFDLQLSGEAEQKFIQAIKDFS